MREQNELFEMRLGKHFLKIIKILSNKDKRFLEDYLKGDDFDFRVLHHYAHGISLIGWIPPARSIQHNNIVELIKQYLFAQHNDIMTLKYLAGLQYTEYLKPLYCQLFDGSVVFINKDNQIFYNDDTQPKQQRLQDWTKIQYTMIATETELNKYSVINNVQIHE
jgi:hypothetical protein